MKYLDLSKTQKRLIDAFIELKPELATSPTITRTEIETLWKTLFDARETGGPKIGYPMWLVKGPKASRGNYIFPSPNPSEQVTEVPVSTKITNRIITSKVEMSPKEDEEFLNDLKEYGLLEK